MRETAFIEQNKEKWQRFETLLEEPSAQDPEKLNDLFIEITDDLSFSRTFYPNRSVRVYLNSLAQRIFFRIYKGRSPQAGKLARFWSQVLPRLVYESRKDFRLSFVVFLSAMLIGALSSSMDPEFINVIMGDRYVEMTRENIASGDPMAVYKEKGEFQMFLGITLNNILVSFNTFVFGALFFVGTLAILIYNGIMLGAFQYFFIEQGLLQESFLTVWMHGTLEISAIVIAGGAGLTMGRGLVFPGSYTRVQAFQRSARRGIKIMIGILPLFVIAGFIEGFFTRYTEAPDLLRALFILACALFVFLYFVWYPVYLARRGFPGALGRSPLSPDSRHFIDFNRINGSSEHFGHLFLLLRKFPGPILWTCLGTAALYTTAAMLGSQTDPVATMSFPGTLFGTLGQIGQFFRNPAIPWLPVLNTLVFALLMAGVGRVVLHLAQPEQSQSPLWLLMYFLRSLIPAAALAMVLYTDQWYTVFLFLGLCPILLHWAYTAQAKLVNPLAALGMSFGLLQGNFSRLFGTFIIIALLGFSIFAIVDSPLARNYLDLVSWVVALDQASMDQLTAVLLTFINTFLMHLILSAFILAAGLVYYSLREATEAPHLLERISQVGRQKTIRGLETE